jgi:hypothetical protein
MGEKPATELSQYERDIIKSAQENHIWLSAFACVRPTDEFKIQLADQILGMLNDKEYMIYDNQDSTNETLKELGRLTPELVVRINKS